MEYLGVISFPTLTANREDEEPHRIVRLNCVLGYVCALADHYGNRELLGKLENLHDHKGDLTVTWKAEPTEGEKEFFTEAWMSAIGDGSPNVEHALT